VNRYLIGLCAAATLLTASQPAKAVWHNTREVVLGTANTLEQGELIIGILMPAVYGITDDLMLTIHPISWALLSPNASLRLRLLDEEIIRLSITVGGAGTVLDAGDTSVPADPRRPRGHVAGGMLATFDVGGGVLISANAGYQRDFAPSDNDFTWSAGVNWVISESSMVVLQGGFNWSFEREEIDAEQVSISYVHAFDVVRIAVGIVYGNFPVALIERRTNTTVDSAIDVGGRSASNEAVVLLQDVPVWPTLDVFWRF